MKIFLHINMVNVAQMDRASDCDSEGCQIVPGHSPKKYTHSQNED